MPKKKLTFDKLMEITDGDQCRQCLRYLASSSPEIAKKITKCLEKRVRLVDREAVAADLYSDLHCLDVEELWAHSGRMRDGYVDVNEKAYEMFYELVERNEMFQHTVIDYVEPPYHDDSVLWNEDIGKDEFVLPKKDWDNLSDEERHGYNEAQSRYEYLHQHRACFHEVYSIEDIIPTIQELPSDLHLYLVMTGSALTNCRWSTTSTFQTDKEKYVAALRRCRRQFGTFTVHLGDIPFSHIRVEHLLILPIPTKIEYLLYHGVSYMRLPWTYVGRGSEATLQQLRSLPVDTTVPFKEWIKYIVDLGMYLNTVFTMKEDSFSIMREHFSIREDPSLSTPTHHDSLKLTFHFRAVVYVATCPSINF